jgi:hypothetical protein
LDGGLKSGRGLMGAVGVGKLSTAKRLDPREVREEDVSR